MKNIEGLMRKAITDFNMIENGDKIAVGLSGGKDSLTLLYHLKRLQRYLPQKFEIGAISVDMFNGQTDYSQIKQFCDKIGVKHTVINSQIYELLFEVRKEKNPCSLCAKIRRGAILNGAKELGYNKVALGHHANDLIETFFLSLFYESRMSTFSPVTHLSKTQMITIRPMIYVWESDIISESKQLKLPILHNPCPADKNTQREFMKQKIKELEKQIPKLSKNVLGAIISPERYHLLDKKIDKADE